MDAVWMLVLLGLTVTPRLNQQARQAGRSDLGSDANTAIYGLVAVSAATVGAVLAGRRPRHPVGWLLLRLGLWFVYGYASWVLLAWRGPSRIDSNACSMKVALNGDARSLAATEPTSCDWRLLRRPRRPLAPLFKPKAGMVSNQCIPTQGRLRL